MSQLMDSEKGNASFKERIEGRKSIANIAPVHIEIRPEKESYTTVFKIHKDRLTSCDGASAIVGFDKDSGQYVMIDETFQAKAARWIADRAIKIGTKKDADAAVQEDKTEAQSQTQGVIDELDFDSWTTE
jgi:hypothetical protein